MSESPARVGSPICERGTQCHLLHEAAGRLRRAPCGAVVRPPVGGRCSGDTEEADTPLAGKPRLAVPPRGRGRELFFQGR